MLYKHAQTYLSRYLHGAVVEWKRNGILQLHTYYMITKDHIAVYMYLSLPGFKY